MTEAQRRARRAAQMSGAILVLQVLCAGFFTYGFLVDVIGLGGEPINWLTYELIELGVIVGLFLGLGLGAATLFQSLRRARRAEDRLAELSGAFHALVESRFADWALTPAERDVAFFVLKGFSTAEIARYRQTSEGTIKSQTAAIYRKAEVTGRSQLVSVFFDDLLGGALGEAPAADPASDPAVDLVADAR